MAGGDRFYITDEVPSSFLADPGSPKKLPGSNLAARLHQPGRVKNIVWGWLVLPCDLCLLRGPVGRLTARGRPFSDDLFLGVVPG